MNENLSTNKTLCITYDEDRLKKIYEVCNRIFKDKDECFYSKEQVKELKKDERNKFI